MRDAAIIPRRDNSHETGGGGVIQSRRNRIKEPSGIVNEYFNLSISALLCSYVSLSLSLSLPLSPFLSENLIHLVNTSIIRILRPFLS